MLRAAKLAATEAKLALDQRLLAHVASGYGVLSDCLDWITTQKKLSAAKQAREVVDNHQSVFAPIMELDTLTNLPGELGSLLEGLPKCVQDTGPLGGESQRLHMFLLDFNVPGVAESSLSNICVSGY